jgi:hypothetical protein
LQIAIRSSVLLHPVERLTKGEDARRQIALTTCLTGRRFSTGRLDRQALHRFDKPGNRPEAILWKQNALNPEHFTPLQ